MCSYCIALFFTQTLKPEAHQWGCIKYGNHSWSDIIFILSLCVGYIVEESKTRKKELHLLIKTIVFADRTCDCRVCAHSANSFYLNFCSKNKFCKECPKTRGIHQTHFPSLSHSAHFGPSIVPLSYHCVVSLCYCTFSYCIAHFGCSYLIIMLHLCIVESFVSLHFHVFSVVLPWVYLSFVLFQSFACFAVFYTFDFCIASCNWTSLTIASTHISGFIVLWRTNWGPLVKPSLSKHTCSCRVCV